MRTGSQVFALLMLFLCVILHTMSLGKSLQLLCSFPLGMLYLSSICIMFENFVGTVYIGGYGGLSKVVHDVRLNSVLDTVVISGKDVCCSVVFGTLVGVFVLCGLGCE